MHHTTTAVCYELVYVTSQRNRPWLDRRSARELPLFLLVAISMPALCPKKQECRILYPVSTTVVLVNVHAVRIRRIRRVYNSSIN